MKTTHYDEREVTESLYRHAGPALVWAALLAFFAVAGASSSRDEPKQMADAAPAVQLMVDDTNDAPAMVLIAPTARDAAPHDAAVVEHEALDPVGVGLNTTQ